MTVPVSLNIVHNRTINNFSVNIAHSRNESTNAFANVQNVGGLAGINYPTAASTDPANWGVPRLSFTGFTGVFGAPATSRTDTRLTTSYFWLHPFTTHQLRIGGDFRLDRSTGVLNTNAPGAFTFTGLYASGGIPVSDAAGNSASFADFLLGIPQQAALQVGGATELRGRSFDAYIEDNWQKSSKLTFNLGLRYELVAAVHRGERAAREPRRRTRIHVRRAGSGRRHRAIHGPIPGGPHQHRHEQHRSPPRVRLPAGEGDDRARRLQHHLQPRVLREHRAPPRGAAAGRRHRDDRRRSRADARHPACAAHAHRLDDEQLGRGQGLRARPDPDVERQHQQGPHAELEHPCWATRA